MLMKAGSELRETDELSRIREQYDEASRGLEGERAELQGEAERIYRVWTECLNLLDNGDFQSLSARLAAEGLHCATGPGCEQYFSDGFATPIVRMLMRSERIGHKLDRLNEEIRTGLVCHKCIGTGTIEKERHYEREGGQVMPTCKVEDCHLCGGSGRLWFSTKAVKE